MPKEKEVKEKGSTISLHHRIKLIGKDGKVKYDSGEKKSDSFVKGFITSLMNLMSDGGITTNIYVDRGGVTRSGITKASWATSNIPVGFVAPASFDTYGIIIGTGNTPVTASDIDLDTPIDDGVAAGEMSHGAQTFVDVVENGANLDLSWSRSFSNSSGDTITIAEIGGGILVSGYRILILRDVLGVPVAVGDGEVIVVEYIWRTAV